MKRWIVVGMLLASSCVLGEMDVITLFDAASSMVATNTSGNAISTDIAIEGLLYGVKIDLGVDADPDLDIDIVTKSAQTGAETTLYSVDDLTADTGWILPRMLAHDTGGTGLADGATNCVMIPIADERIELRCYDGDTNTISTKAILMIQK